MPYTGPNKLKPGEKFLVCVWGPGDFSISKRKGFKTFEGAERYAKKRIDDDPGVHEVSVLTKDKGNPDWPWQRIALYKNDARERIRAAAKRDADERRRK